MSRTILLLGLVLLLGVPPTAADTSTHEEHAMVPAAGTPHLSDTHRFPLELGDGEQMTVTLAWEGPEPTDLDLGASGPGGVCVVTDVECMADSATGIATAAACQASGEGKQANVATRTETLSIEADRSGTWTVDVMAATALPGELVPYEITVTTSGYGAETLRGPDGSQFIRWDGHCRTPALVPGPAG